MIEEGGARPTPLILDVSVITAVARGDTDIMTLIQDYDASGQPLVVPVLAVTAAATDVSGEDAADLLGGLELFGNIAIAPLQGTDQAVRLATIMAKTELDPWDAHVAAVADASVCPILTLNAAKWRPRITDLDQPLHIIEIADPADTAGGQDGGSPP